MIAACTPIVASTCQLSPWLLLAQHGESGSGAGMRYLQHVG